MTELATRRRRLDTMRVIASFLGLSPRMVRRLASPHRPEDLRLPLFRLTDTDGPNARLYAYVDELAAWEGRMAAAGRGLRQSATK
jgi:hypothetical protein